MSFSDAERETAVELLKRGISPWSHVQRLALIREREAAERAYGEFIAAKIRAASQ